MVSLGAARRALLFRSAVRRRATPVLASVAVDCEDAVSRRELRRVVLVFPSRSKSLGRSRMPTGTANYVPCASASALPASGCGPRAAKEIFAHCALYVTNARYDATHATHTSLEGNSRSGHVFSQNG